MTKKEAHEFLKNKKVYVENRSEEIQNKLFTAGFEWALGREIQHLDKPYLFIDEENTITQSSDTIFFYSESKHQKITAKEILDIEIEEEPYQFKPFEPVLWRFDINDYWRAGIYSHFRNNEHYIIGAGYMLYDNVISYNGNNYKLNKITD